MSDVTPDVEPQPKRRPVWPLWTVAIVFAVLYSYALWAGIGNLVGYPQVVAANYDLGISVIGWVLLILGVILSPLVFLVSLLLGRRRGLVARSLIYATGLCVVSAVMSSLIVSPALVDFLA